MRVIALADKLSSGWYRARQPIAALKEVEPSIDTSIAEQGLPVYFQNGRAADVALNSDLVDVVLMVRPTYYFMPDVIRILQRRGVKVVVDVDDDYHSVHALNRAFDEQHPRRNPASNWNHFRRCAAVADLVTTSTPALAERYGSHGRVAVLRNCATDSWLGIPKKRYGKTVGWAGALSNHPNDLGVTHGGVEAAVEAAGGRFLCVGGKARIDEVKAQLGLSKAIATDWVDLDFHPYVVSRIDVGIVPLAQTTFNAGKSWLKGLEYSALGIPFVASPTPEYESLSELGLGVLASDRRRSWRREILALLNQRDRAEVGLRSREIVREHLSIGRNAWRWAEAWESALLRPSQARRPVAV